MKKIFIILLLSITIVTFASCGKDEKIEGISQKAELTIVDIADEYIATQNELKVYKKHDGNMSYVNIEELIVALDGIIIDLSINKDDEKISISYELNYDVDKTYTYEIVFNSKDNSIFINDMDFLEMLNVQTQNDFGAGLAMVDYDVDGEVESKTINLNDYESEITLEENNFYIPFYLGNLFFTGSYVYLYEIGNKVYICDQFSETTSLDAEILIAEKDELTNEMKEHTESFYKIYLDFFYGLKEYQSRTSYIEFVDSHNIDDASNFNELYQRVSDMIYKLDDLHSSPYSYGYNGRGFFYQNADMSNLKISKFYTAVDEYGCRNRAGEVKTRKLNNTTVILEINGFSGNTKALLENIENDIKNYDNIAIDLTCNSGGMLAGVINLLTYITDDLIELTNHDYGTGQTYTQYYRAETLKNLNKKFYLMTSEVTFSAANLTASIIKDNNYATIVGEKSLGGACAISLVISPDGTTLSMSSNMALINKNKETIEGGIVPDFYVSGIDAIESKILELVGETL